MSARRVRIDSVEDNEYLVRQQNVRHDLELQAAIVEEEGAVSRVQEEGASITQTLCAPHLMRRANE
jgi:uncharacterized membrane protein YcaP (DUF421 family)